MPKMGRNGARMRTRRTTHGLCHRFPGMVSMSYGGPGAGEATAEVVHRTAAARRMRPDPRPWVGPRNHP